MNQPTPIRRPLTDAERNLISELTIWKMRRNIAAQSGVNVDQDSTSAALDD